MKELGNEKIATRGREVKIRRPEATGELLVGNTSRGRIVGE
jgi:hypothetical protein